MKVILQRVKEASVTVENIVHGDISNGLLVLLGITHDDRFEDIEWLVKKILKMRIFNDSDGKMNLSVLDIKGEIMIISQFTLFASTKKGNRPSYINSARPEIANKLYEKFIEQVTTETKLKVATGKFGTHMDVKLWNDGPVTIIIDSKNRN